jgi:hypothetical protein
MRLRPENPGKSRKIPEKNKKSSCPTTESAKQKEPVQPIPPILSNYDQF